MIAKRKFVTSTQAAVILPAARKAITEENSPARAPQYVFEAGAGISRFATDADQAMQLGGHVEGSNERDLVTRRSKCLSDSALVRGIEDSPDRRRQTAADVWMSHGR